MMKITRNRGAWYGRVERVDYDLPIGHSCFITRDRHYVDNGCLEPIGVPVNPRWLQWIMDVRAAGVMIIQQTKIGPDVDKLGRLMKHCTGYTGVFAVQNVRFDEDGDRVFTCEFVSRIRTVQELVNALPATSSTSPATATASATSTSTH
jgi:hypothetical protein